MSIDTEELDIAIKRKTVRFTIDFDATQHKFLKTFSYESGVKSALIIRALVYLLEINESVADAVIDEIFRDEEELAKSDENPANGRTEAVKGESQEDKKPEKRKTVRFTIDFDSEQHRFLKLFSLESGVRSALIIRSLVYLLEISETMANAVINEIFAE